ncbi:hypothetical protein [Helicobacter rodentium]|uniref:hypothetical protein n=1 Tax=Helicobacter rodentium TaxID=59617 RepID=UPI000690A3BE|nr:hypothetical protein [Helicobacter rodentium]
MKLFEKLKKPIIAYIANNFKLSNKLTRVNNSLNLKLAEIEAVKSMENEIFALRNFVLPHANLPIHKNHFLLFSYNKHIPKYSHHNLGDFIQTLATKNALLSLNPKATFEFFDRDSLISYYPAGGGQIAL